MTTYYWPREQHILPAEMSHKDAASVQRVPSAALPSQALPAVPIPADTTLTELSHRDVAVAGISPSGLMALPDPDGFKTVTYTKKSATITTRAETAETSQTAPRRC